MKRIALLTLSFLMVVGQAFAQTKPKVKSRNINAIIKTTNKDYYTFKLSKKVTHKEVTYKNRYGITIAADLYLPKNRGNEPLEALAISGPFGAVKEQSSGLYAQTMAERGFAVLAFGKSKIDRT